MITFGGEGTANASKPSLGTTAAAVKMLFEALVSTTAAPGEGLFINRSPFTPSVATVTPKPGESK